MSEFVAEAGGPHDPGTDGGSVGTSPSSTHPSSTHPSSTAPLGAGRAEHLGGAAPGAVPLTAVSAEDDPVDLLREQVGQLVVAHPGVLRLEPTLLGALHGLRQRSSLDGIQLDLHGRVVDLDVNVATRSTYQARTSVLELHHQLGELVTAHGYVPGTLEISVLAIEEPQD